MTHVSPTVWALWSVISVVLLGFLIVHLWKFDRFQCLRWGGSGRQAGTFKRIMTYSYLLSVPLLVVYSVGMTTIKYREGWVFIPGHGIIPSPHEIWHPSSVVWITPLQIIFSCAWALEIVSHLEELCFWQFLISVRAHQAWFRSINFVMWVVGSLLAIIGLPVVTILTRQDPLKCEAWTIVAGGSGSLLITILFLRVLYCFPAFIARVKAEGADPEVVVRLSTFHELNIIRVVFRFFFVVPLLTLGIDGAKPHRHHLNESLLWTDLLAIIGGIGCITSSVLTLLIFFPRSIQREAGYRPRNKSSINSRNTGNPPASPTTPHFVDTSAAISDKQHPFQHHGSPRSLNQSLSPSNGGSPYTPTLKLKIPDDRKASYTTTMTPFSAEDRKKVTGDGVWEMIDMSPYLEQGSQSAALSPPASKPRPQRPKRPSTLHPIVLNYTSPIDLIDAADGARNAHQVFV